MRAICSAAVSSALLFLLGVLGTHPASIALASAPIAQDMCTSVLIAEIYPCAAAGDEYVQLRNRGDEAVNMTGWSLSDGEGIIEFEGLVLGGQSCLSISENGSSYERAVGQRPDIDAHGWSSGCGIVVSGSFRLADAGDELMLATPDGDVADVVAYGPRELIPIGWSGDPLPLPRQGEVFRRLILDGVPLDSGSSSDWEPFREHKYGFTDLDSPASLVPAGGVTGFTSPDCALDVVLAAIDGAKSNLRVCCYELSSVPVCAALELSAASGVNVSVLVEAVPVGGMSDSQVRCLSRLAAAGCDVRVLGGRLEDDIVRHVGTLHAKYVTIDEEVFVCLSENLVEEGVPQDRIFGNRGWGVLIRDRALASWLCHMFDEDSRPSRLDVWDWRSDARFIPDAVYPPYRPDEHPVGLISPCSTAEPSIVTIYPSPDASLARPFLPPLISQARSIVFEQFQADLDWTYRWSDYTATNPMVHALREAMASGASERGLFDSSWYNVDRNGLVLRSLTSSATAIGSQTQFRFMDERSPIGVLHNKGLVLDASVVVSSNNWVYSSFARNRELAVVVESPSLATYFRQGFELDWVSDSAPPVADAGMDLFVNASQHVRLDGSASSDDRMIANWSWDLDGDGVWDLYGDTPVFVAPGAGCHEVTLRVTDSWGNSAYDTVIVEISDGRRNPLGTSQSWDIIWFVLVSSAASMLTLLKVSRKFNLIPQGSRRTGRR